MLFDHEKTTIIRLHMSSSCYAEGVSLRNHNKGLAGGRILHAAHDGG